MATERERKSSRFSRWRQRRRLKAVRDSDIKRELKAERAGKEPSRDPRRSGDGPGMGTGGFGPGI
jgi:hypothetical protein